MKKKMIKMFGNIYYEIYALLVLDKLIGGFNNKFIKSESPDWISDNVGIEVARGINPYETEIIEYIEQHYGKTREEIGEDRIKKAKGKMYFTEKDVLYGASLDGLIDADAYIHFCNKIFDKKIKKLNESYVVKSKNILFLFSTGYSIPQDVNDFLEHVIIEQRKYEKRFDEVYLFVDDMFYTIDLKKEKIVYKQLTTDDLVHFKKTAKTLEKTCEEGKLFSF